jgi:tripartite-type tricarboxylate transporter receptor subunit TctC
MANPGIRSLATLAVGVVAAAHFTHAAAQGWPERTVRVVNPFAAGAASDVVARLIFDKVTQRLGKSFIVDKLNAEINAARAMPDVAQKLKDLGFSLEGPGPRPEEFAEFVKSEMALWARVVKEARIPQQ